MKSGKNLEKYKKNRETDLNLVFIKPAYDLYIPVSLRLDE